MSACRRRSVHTIGTSARATRRSEASASGTATSAASAGASSVATSTATSEALSVASPKLARPPVRPMPGGTTRHPPQERLVEAEARDARRHQHDGLRGLEDPEGLGAVAPDEQDEEQRMERLERVAPEVHADRAAQVAEVGPRAHRWRSARGAE